MSEFERPKEKYPSPLQEMFEFGPEADDSLKKAWMMDATSSFIIAAVDSNDEGLRESALEIAALALERDSYDWQIWAATQTSVIAEFDRPHAETMFRRFAERYPQDVFEPAEDIRTRIISHLAYDHEMPVSRIDVWKQFYDEVVAPLDDYIYDFEKEFERAQFTRDFPDLVPVVPPVTDDDLLS